jgi:hypothetical protein
MTNVLDPGRSARSKAKRAQESQEALIVEQRKKEKLNVAEKESEISKRQALIQRKGGRSLLVATSPRGVQQLGG